MSYRMSFTSAGLLLRESVIIAQAFRDTGDWQKAREDCLSRNLLQARKPSSATRTVRELIGRLKTLTADQLMESIARNKPDEEEVAVHLVTISDEFKAEKQDEFSQQIKISCAAIGIDFTWEYDYSNAIHARHIVTDTGWKILLDRGLDIFQQYDLSNAFSFSNRMQRYRACKAFEVTYVRQEG